MTIYTKRSGPTKPLAEKDVESFKKEAEMALKLQFDESTKVKLKRKKKLEHLSDEELLKKAGMNA